MDQSLFYRAIAIQRHNASCILQELPEKDLLSCSRTTRYLRHLAFTIHFRDLTFKICPPVEPTAGKDDPMDEDEDGASNGGVRDGDSHMDESEGDADDEGSDEDEDMDEADGSTRDDSSEVSSLSDGESSSTDPTEDEDATGGAVHLSLEDVLQYLTDHPYMNRYVQSLELNVRKPKGVARKTPLPRSDPATFLALLHRLPSLANLWLKNVMLVDDAAATARLAAAAGRIDLQHLCIDVTPGGLQELDPGYFRALLTPFRTLAELRVRRCDAAICAPALAPFPAHLALAALAVDEYVCMRYLFDALTRHPRAGALRRLDVQEDVAGYAQRPPRLAFQRLVRAVGPHLEHFGVGVLTITNEAMEGECALCAPLRVALSDMCVCAPLQSMSSTPT